jgi:two-component system, LuxR family, response regulator FixJ
MLDTITIALVDDDAAVLDSTLLVLDSEGIKSICFERASDLLAELDLGHHPTCIVSDVRMPGMSGMELQAELNRRSGSIPLILMTGHGDIGMAVQAIKEGASDFLEKPFDVRLLAEAVRRAAGQSRELERRAKGQKEVEERAAQLSARQHEVMILVAEGYSNKQIAAKLGISARTVETYRLWVMEKMGAGSVAALVRMVMLLPGDSVRNKD